MPEQEIRNPPEGSLDWWMSTITGDLGQPTSVEREERARLATLVIQAWDDARKPVLHTDVDVGMPANLVCGYLVSAMAELLSKYRREAIRTMETWCTLNAWERSVVIHRYFRDVWTR